MVTVLVLQSSIDPALTANSDSVVPTQRAVKAYIEAQIGGGGALPNAPTVLQLVTFL